MKVRPKVFIVEDEALIRMHTKSMLKKMGYEVVGESASGEDALNKIKAGNPDVVLMDINLAGEINGIETARSIQEDCPTPIVFASGFNFEDEIKKANISNIVGFINKPLEKRDLKSLIDKAAEVKKNY